VVLFILVIITWSLASQLVYSNILQLGSTIDVSDMAKKSQPTPTAAPPPSENRSSTSASQVQSGPSKPKAKKEKKAKKGKRALSMNNRRQGLLD